jgi:hypothetical protein
MNQSRPRRLSREGDGGGPPLEAGADGRLSEPDGRSSSARDLSTVYREARANRIFLRHQVNAAESTFAFGAVGLLASVKSETAPDV